MKDKIISMAIIVLILTLIPSASGSSDFEKMNFRYVRMDFDGTNSTVSFTINGSDIMRIKFTRIYVGSLQPLFMGWGNLNDMKVSREDGKDVVMGNYIHIRMWKNTTITRILPWHKDYYALISIDFYISQRSYEKKVIMIGNRTVRFDITIDTNCPDDFIFLEQQITCERENKNMEIFEKHGGWEEIKKMKNISRHNFSQDDLGLIGFGNENMVFEYGWLNMKNLQTLYIYNDNKFIFYFAYENSGHIVQDPYISLPVPIFTEMGKKVVNFLMEHVISISIGLFLSLLLVAFPIVLRRIRL